MTKIEKLKNMHNVMQYMNNENAYWEWALFCPDCPEEEDFEFITENSMEEAEELFESLLDTYGECGLFEAPPEVYEFALEYHKGIKNITM